MILYRKFQNEGKVEEPSMVDRFFSMFSTVEPDTAATTNTSVELNTKNISRDDVMDTIVSKMGGSKDKLTTLMDVVAYHESKTLQPEDDKGMRNYTFYNPKARQVVDYGDHKGVGSGLYQFEIGENSGGITGMNRARNFFNDRGWDIPDWIKKADGLTTFDVGTLTPEQQDIVFLTNHYQAEAGIDGISTLSRYLKGLEKDTDFWMRSHRRSNAGDGLANILADSTNMVTKDRRRLSKK